MSERHNLTDTGDDPNLHNFPPESAACAHPNTAPCRGDSRRRRRVGCRHQHDGQPTDIQWTETLDQFDKFQHIVRLFHHLLHSPPFVISRPQPNSMSPQLISLTFAHRRPINIGHIGHTTCHPLNHATLEFDGNIPDRPLLLSASHIVSSPRNSHILRSSKRDFPNTKHTFLEFNCKEKLPLPLTTRKKIDSPWKFYSFKESNL